MTSSSSSDSPNKAVFHTTRWTLVLQAGGSAPESRAALAELCETYWTPVYRFLRREGRSKDESEELAQAFFAKLLAGAGIGRADPAKGRFRSYLLGALKHFLTNHRRDANREKRGGDVVIQSINSGGSDTSPGLQLPDPSAQTGDAWFDRHWALTIMQRGLDQVRDSFEQSGKAKQFAQLQPWLMGAPEGRTQADVAEQLGMSPSAVKVAIHRLRQKFGAAIRREIADTVDTEEEIREELRYLIDVLQAG